MPPTALTSALCWSCVGTRMSKGEHRDPEEQVCKGATKATGAPRHGGAALPTRQGVCKPAPHTRNGRFLLLPLPPPSPSFSPGLVFFLPPLPQLLPALRIDSYSLSTQSPNHLLNKYLLSTHVVLDIVLDTEGRTGQMWSLPSLFRNIPDSATLCFSRGEKHKRLTMGKDQEGTHMSLFYYFSGHRLEMEFGSLI